MFVLALGALLGYLAWMRIGREYRIQVTINRRAVALRRHRRKVKISLRALRAARRVRWGLGDSLYVVYGSEGHVLHVPLWCLAPRARGEVVREVVSAARMEPTTPRWLAWLFGIERWRAARKEKQPQPEPPTDKQQP